RAEEPRASRPAVEREVVLGERDLARRLLRGRRVEDARAALERLDRVPAERELLADLAEDERVRDRALGAAARARARAAAPGRLRDVVPPAWPLEVGDAPGGELLLRGPDDGLVDRLPDAPR